MKKRFLTIIFKWLKKQIEQNAVEDTKDLPYHSLSPIGNADIENDYKKSLDWALNNRQKFDIKNIALTGPYGSGKSSILKTYIASSTINSLHFLNISLATFKEEDDDDRDGSKKQDSSSGSKKEDNNNGSKKEDLIRLIELSILQQIFYHEDDSKIPDSRFRKIKSYSRKGLFGTAISVFFLVLSVLQLIFSNLFEFLLKIRLNERETYVIHFIALGVSSLASFILIYKSIRILNGIKISKLNIQNAEIEIDKGVSKSILNHHIDEILYFFEVTKYNVVIIEDLDRFKQTEIFTKLREINQLINNSKKVGKHVVFIYAVRDDMFKEKNERTKFFDFIIPVIPIINPSNSSQKFLEKQSLYNYEISENLIDSISLFVDDMRLVHNILNEFYLYHQKLNKSINQDKLLALIVYKNIFPLDFTLLDNNEGFLYNAINNKHKYINASLLEIDKKISLKRAEISELDSLQIKHVKELRYLYLLFYVTSLNNFSTFSKEYEEISLENMTEDENFESLTNNLLSYKTAGSYSFLKIKLKFNDIEQKVDPSNSYLKRLTAVKDWNNNKLDFLKQELRQLEFLKNQTRNATIQKLLEQGHVEIEIVDQKQKNLVSTLLRNGFIDENYLDYVSLFYEVSITKADYQFLYNVKSQIPTPFDYKLNKIEKVIAKINLVEFDKEFVLNNSLLEFILKEEKFKNVSERLFFKLKDESKRSVEFIDGFIDVTLNIHGFIRLLITRWTNIWDFLEHKSNFTKERKDLYFKLIIDSAEIASIQKLGQNPLFKKRLLEEENFLNFSTDERIKQIIEVLGLKFTNLNLKDSPKQLVDYVYNGNFYDINLFMIRDIFKVKEDFNESDFNTKNYFSISKSKSESLKKYIEAHINYYIENVYLMLDNNCYEEENSFITLLNNEELSFEHKIKLTEKVETLVKDVSKIKDIEVIELLFEKSKASLSWDNIFYCYQHNENHISDSIIIFLENNDNAVEFSKTKIKMDVEGERKYTDFILTLIKTEKFDNKVYESILKAIPYHFTSLALNTLSTIKVSLLTKYNVLVFNKENFKSLKENHPDLHIDFIEINKTKYLKSISDFDLDENDLLKILKSSIWSGEEKNKIIENINLDTIAVNKDSVKIIGELVLKNGAFRISNEVVKLIMVNDLLTVEQRIRVHNWKQNQVDIDYYDTFLNSLGEPYSDVTNRGKRPLLVNTEYNLKLVNILETKKYISMSSIETKGIRVITFRNISED